MREDDFSKKCHMLQLDISNIDKLHSLMIIEMGINVPMYTEE